ncbi:hypothetical protein F4861DRAFT_174131 [Xylaria intraflava]|nr:hypothetical protein F4861DRAFT_174131 [Xylaria intraflava]
MSRRAGAEAQVRRGVRPLCQLKEGLRASTLVALQSALAAQDLWRPLYVALSEVIFIVPFSLFLPLLPFSPLPFIIRDGYCPCLLLHERIVICSPIPALLRPSRRPSHGHQQAIKLFKLDTRKHRSPSQRLYIRASFPTCTYSCPLVSNWGSSDRLLEWAKPEIPADIQPNTPSAGAPPTSYNTTGHTSRILRFEIPLLVSQAS